MLIKNPTRCNSMQIFIYWKVTLHVSGVTAPIIRSTKNCNRNLQYSYFPPTRRDRDARNHELKKKMYEIIVIFLSLSRYHLVFGD